MPCCKNYIILSGIMAILLGLTSSVFAIVKIEEKSGEEWTDESAYSSQQIFYIVLLILGLLLVLMGLFGSCGGYKQQSCCKSVFKIFNIILLIIFIIMGVASIFLIYFVGPTIQDTDDCYDNKYVGKTGTFDQTAQDLFCTDECPCYVEIEDQVEFLLKNPEAVFSTDKDDKKVQRCSAFEKETRTEFKAANSFLTLLENNFECAGFCEPSPYYLFTDVNREVKKSESCAELVGREIEDNFMVYMIFCFVLALYTLVNIFATCCVKKEDEQKKDKYIDANYDKRQGGVQQD